MFDKFDKFKDKFKGIVTAILPNKDSKKESDTKECVDNFDLINSMLKFEDSKHFYFVQLIKRKKDNPEMKKDVSIVDNFFIYSNGDLPKLKNKIVDLCELNNARAYIRMNVRDAEKIALETIKITTQCIIDRDYRGVKSAYLSACGQYSSDKNKKWIIDIDTKDEILIKEVIEHILTILPKGGIIYGKVPTRNGLHLLTSGFNPQLFKDKYPKIDIHKDNMTVLYAK